ncbi:ferrous iron transport protein B [Thermodesulfatator indicus DSM 15286]|uniref:Ferrous iron transport protein B n=1 Tax=Thermodesulfatator indicus (strain DSM 15286 / JCM 11887 / CIR29812) TaxID=667014 RepID=F8AE28_THEID|nr:ferrous iron transport protein B [Thermodesulfatator indicus]AEH46074.1 ferrous iron transport protein B [Thermodesulfatator indicus DSM 15286]
MSEEIKIALAGNPNAGKTTIFNALTGAKQKVGNYPGVTVERKEGFLRLNGYFIRVVDLPGTYSLTSYSPEEVVARRVIVEEKPAVVVNIIDASNLERNLYLTMQLFELGVPVVLVLNMIDDAEKKGLKINFKRLEKKIGVPVIPTIGHRGIGFDKLKKVLKDVIENPDTAKPKIFLSLPKPFQEEVERLTRFLSEKPELSDYPVFWLALKAIEGDEDIINFLVREKGLGKDFLALLDKARQKIRKDLGEEPEPLLAEYRYRTIQEILKDVVKYHPQKTLSDRIDAIVCHRIFGIPIFLGIMLLLFQAVFSWSAPFMDLINQFFSWLGEFIGSRMGDSFLKSLIVDGIIAGVGGVLVFLPQILILFFLISLLEDSGYMPRAAFVVDRLLKPFGLNGKSFVPLLSSFACNIPGIMATRTIENYQQRLLTILAAPFMSCSARLPIYTLLIAAFIPAKKVWIFNLQGLVLLAMYLTGLLVALITVVLARLLFFRGQPSPFLMELPPYRFPTLKNILLQMWNRSVLYVRKAGTVILGISIVMWILFTFPLNPELSKDYKALKANAPNKIILEQIKREEAAEKLSKSYAGHFGRLIEPILKPLGFDWRIGIALTSAFAAKEVLVATLSQIYALSDVEGNEVSLIEHIKKDPIFNTVTAIGLMLFSLLMVPCMATLPVIKMETGSWRWPTIIVAWTLSVAWLVTFIWVHFIGPSLVALLRI